MKPIKNGNIKFEFKPRYPMKLTCDICEAEMEVDSSDIEFTFRGVEVTRCFYCKCVLQMGDNFEKTNAEFRADYIEHLFWQKNPIITREDNVPYHEIKSLLPEPEKKRSFIDWFKR